jgi:hypothetical protein
MGADWQSSDKRPEIASSVGKVGAKSRMQKSERDDEQRQDKARFGVGFGGHTGLRGWEQDTIHSSTYKSFYTSILHFL